MADEILEPEDWYAQDEIPEMLEGLGIDPSVGYYIYSRGLAFPEPWQRPLIQTPVSCLPDNAVFDPARVDKVLRVCHALRHTAGEWAGRPLDPDPWQVAYVLAPVFGWIKPDDDGMYVRCYTNVWVELPRKNGKTTLAAAVALYMTAADGEAGAQVVVGATTQDQAGFCFRPIAQLARQSPVLSKHVEHFKAAHKIVHEASGSYFQAISSVAEAQHGANLHCAIVDEVHLHKTPDLVEALETGTASRRQPIIWMITTADEGKPNSIYSRRRKRIEQIADGIIHDDSQYGVIWAAARSERDLTDPFSPETQKRANPGYGTSPTSRYLTQAANKAQDSPADYANYLRLHLGIRTKQTTRYISLLDWDTCDGEVNEDDFIGQECYGGLDLASVSDITAFCITFPDYENDRYASIWRAWIPEAALADLDKRTANEASSWVEQGWLVTTEGDIVDYRAIVDQIKADARKFRLNGVAHDPWNAPGIIRELNEDTIETVSVNQGYSGMSGAMNEMLRLVKSRRYSHGGNPVARWCVDNLMVDIDAGGSVRPNKGAAMDKIDLFVAGVMSLRECLIQGSDIIEARDAIK